MHVSWSGQGYCVLGDDVNKRPNCSAPQGSVFSEGWHPDKDSPKRLSDPRTTDSRTFTCPEQGLLYLFVYLPHLMFFNYSSVLNLPTGDLL
ncbi:hypothetical protein EXN66_Car014177 [Channa argus]|uniref:Uncharacterized protein n=1 Tax=Channa argus TaxID=215402 RepID=A0A6G1Q8K6_CHAAH|nr:hypothetical protein EXN66_Car014177 [Channa argus]